MVVFLCLIVKSFNFIKDDKTMLEKEPLENQKKKRIICLKHDKFWQCMDTLRDKKYLNNLYKKKKLNWLKVKK